MVGAIGHQAHTHCWGSTVKRVDLLSQLCMLQNSLSISFQTLQPIGLSTACISGTRSKAGRLHDNPSHSHSHTNRSHSHDKLRL